MREISQPNCSFKFCLPSEQRNQRACMNPNNLNQMSSFNKHWKNQGKTFSVSIYSVRRAQGCNSDTPTFNTLLRISREPLTLKNIPLSRRPESRQILKAQMTNNSQDRSFHSFSDSRHGRIGQNKKADYG